MVVSVVRDRTFRAHDPGPHHPECPARLDAIDRALSQSDLRLVEVPARDAREEEILRVHDAEYVRTLLSFRGRRARLDADTSVSEGSIDATVLAAGSTVELATRVARGETPPGIALVRPPGHHATADRAMGFCLINNVAVAAAVLRAEGLAERIAIYDWDVHHGNGTEAIFYADPDVLYMSTHQWPLYPGTGPSKARGIGKGEGATINVPLPEGTNDAMLLSANDEVLLKAARDFRPDFILISAGFDPYERDPIGGFQITVGGFAELAKRWADLAADVSGAKIAAVLEGGYDLDGLGACVVATLREWSA